MLKIKSIKFIDDPVFKNKEFDFTTRSNDVASTIIIVGENGSGKTRLLNILEQLTYFIFTSETVLIQKVIGQNKPFILKDEIDKSNNFFLNAKGYEIEYQYEYTKSEKEFIECNPQLLDNKNEHEIISSKLGNCFYFKLKILTNYYTNSNSEANYNILIQNIKFYDSEHKLIEDKQLENKILMRFRVSIPNFNNFNDPFLFGALFKFTHYTFYFDTLAELVINHPIYKLHISKLINEKDELNKYIATKEENSNINNKISFDIDTKSFDEIFHRINTSYEEILLKNYYDEFDVNKIEYPFNEIKLHLHKLNNYADAMNEFFKITSKNKKYLMIDKIQDNKIYFKKDNKYFHYSKLSSGEKKILDESIFLLKILKNDFTNYKYPNFVQGNTIYFIDEIELGFHPLWNANILNLLKKTLKGLTGQIFISTHSEIIPYSIDIKTDTLINMNDDKETVFFKNYNSIQDFVNNSLHVDYEDFIDEYDIWVEGRSDKVLLNTAIQELNKEGSKTTISFNIRFANNFKFNKHSSDHNDDLNKEFNKLINGAVGVRTQFLSWLSKNDKKNNSLKEIKPKCFIFDNDCEGQEKYKSIISILNQKDILNQIDIKFNKIIDNKIFNGWEVRRQRKDFKKDFKEEKAFILIYKNEEEIEDFIKDEEIKENCKKNKANIEEIIKNNNNWKQKIANSFEEYIRTLQEILSNKQEDNNDNLYF